MRGIGTSNIEHETSNIEVQKNFRPFDVRCSMFDIRCSLLIVAFGLMVGGCNGTTPPTTRPYIPPDQTLSLAELIERLNAARAPLTSLYLESTGEGGFEANLRESRSDPARFVNGDIVAMYLAPDKLRLKGKKAGPGDVFDLGSDGERFWLYLPTEKQLSYGTFAGLDPETARQLPVRPDLVLQVLGVTPLDADLLKTPAPTLRFNPDSDVYMLTYSEPVDGPPPRWNVVKEVWYDRATLLPKLVVLFDANGDPVMRAYLSRHVPVGGDGPRLASRYDLYFPESGGTMWLSFDEMNLRNPQNRSFPRASSFNPPSPADVPNARNLDEPLPPPGAGEGPQ